MKWIEAVLTFRLRAMLHLSVFAGLALWLAFPHQAKGASTPAEWSKDDWKWSLYAKKVFTPGFMLSGLIGRDHVRLKSMWENSTDREEALTKPGHWYWMMRVTFGV